MPTGEGEGIGDALFKIAMKQHLGQLIRLEVGVRRFI